ncbi:hypothetical protein CBW24_07795 [Pacificitalea manganoxidans]|uniref:Uncharacterized protein n=1 Tax=Pacificitalea manganoxidans TaxID=1411902 RepID=A0A291LYY6_9RHOB|nr:hypothetical protein [Pacificitalea manganoxidans]ATI41912.1 hypothetical protein CBW24_07795 [Pacificitalea manganoxidans]MDR6309397.1 hypothetical protein [Pacificitalea manganoxidans]
MPEAGSEFPPEEAATHDPAAGPGGPTPGGKPRARQARALVDDPSTSGPEFLLACAWLFHHGTADCREAVCAALDPFYEEV